MQVPPLLYGTAWKEDRTAALVRQALAAGFRGIDTANQRKHYFEAAVGEGIRASGVPRDELFLQTKFTYARGQDHRLPYDPRAPLDTQVQQSFESSLEHLGVERLDAYLLHGPSAFPRLGEADHVVWRAMEALHASGRVALLGVSNVTAAQVDELWAAARVKPAIVQNRCFALPHADAEVRAFCRQNGVRYEGFSLLTAIPHVVRGPVVGAIATRRARTSAQIVLAYCLARGMIVLTGTSDPAHMAQDLDAPTIRLDDAELAAIDAAILG